MQKYLNLAPAPVDCSMFQTMTGSGFMIPKWSVAFEKLYLHVCENLRLLMNIQAEPELFFLACPGTGGYEALLRNCLQEGDEILVLSNGYFGERMSMISKILGLVPHTLSFDWDKPLPVKDIIERISSEFYRIKALSMVHLETSTGIINDLCTLGTALQKSDVLFLVDAVSSVGPHQVDFKNWGIDGLITVPNKGLLSPPGVCIITLSKKFCDQMNSVKTNSYFFDFGKIIRQAHHHTAATTIAIPSIEYLDNVVSMMLSQGLETYTTHCKDVADALRKGLIDDGHSLFGKEGLSNAITTINLPRQCDSKNYIRSLETQFALFVGEGMGKLKDKTLRIAHYGNFAMADVSILMDILHKGLHSKCS